MIVWGRMGATVWEMGCRLVGLEKDELVHSENRLLLGSKTSVAVDHLSCNVVRGMAGQEHC